MALLPQSTLETLRRSREMANVTQLEMYRQLSQSDRMSHYIRRSLRESAESADRTSETCIVVARQCREVANG